MHPDPSQTAASRPGRPARFLFGLTLFLSALTGFAQMPIFKRYYIADIPGLGWLAQFYVTYTLHYISAIAFIAIAAYIITDFLVARRSNLRVTLWGWIRGAMLAWILASGVLLVFRNLPGYRYAPDVIVFLNFSHLGMVVIFLATALVLLKKRWTSHR